jgi:hypothetical protein
MKFGPPPPDRSVMHPSKKSIRIVIEFWASSSKAFCIEFQVEIQKGSTGRWASSSKVLRVEFLT